MTPAEVVLARLDGVRSTGPGRWLARCPSHDDRRASLSIREVDDGRILVHDFGGCSATDVLASIGLSLCNLYPRALGEFKRERRPFVAIDVLRACAHELVVTVMILQRVQAPEPERERLLLAAERLQRAVEVAGA